MKQATQRGKAIVGGSEYTEGGWRCEWVGWKNTMRSDEMRDGMSRVGGKLHGLLDWIDVDSKRAWGSMSA